MLEAEISYTMMVVVATVVIVKYGDDDGPESVAWLVPGWLAGLHAG